MQNLDLTNLVLGAWLLFVVIRRQLEPRVIRFKLEFFILIILLGKWEQLWISMGPSS